MLKNFLLIILLLFEESYHISFSTAREVSAFISSAALYPFGEFTPTPISLTEDRPILLIHGAGGNRATWYPLMQTLEKHQIGPLYSYNYHPKNRLSALKTALAEIRDQATEDIEVILIGHSLGAITACEYALHPEWHVPGVKIHQIIAIAGRTSPHANRLHFCFEHLISPLTLIDDQCHTLPLTCIDTDHDWLVPQCHRAEQTITIPNHSHLSLLFSQKTHHQII
ncbi:MAG: alpha/beta hydrolase, partial [Chlamydiia bacterium]|nr:alpha/beta hydrolase [Chlamydiia bacterium]